MNFEGAWLTRGTPPTHTAGMDIEDLKARYLNLEFDRKDFTIRAEDAATVARLSGETRPDLIDPEHPDFSVTPAYLASLASGRHLPIDFPKLGGLPVDGGKAVRCLATVRPHEKLTGRTHLHDIYDKSGRSGRMIFLVSRMELFNEQEQKLAMSDARMILREKSS